MNYLQISERVKSDYLSEIENYEIKSLDDLSILHDRLIEIRMALILRFGFDVHPHYRGEQLYGRDIVPGMFRPPFSENINLDNARKVEAKGVEIFKQRVVESFGESILFKNKESTEHAYAWDILFQAQHAGVKTNLIDLSTSIFNSAFFACEPSERHDDKDAQLWCLLVPSEFIYGESTKYDKPCYPILNPFQLDVSFVCNVPTYIDDIDERIYQFRLFRQHGRLFVSSDEEINVPLNHKEFWKNMLVRIRISAENKKIIYSLLNQSGIDHARLILNETEDAKQFISAINEDMKK